jgi:hypothetical protein
MAINSPPPNPPLIKRESKSTRLAWVWDVGCASLLRFLLGGSIVTVFSFGCSTFYSKNIWQNYWQETIYRVQTTDFNILSYTLPTKLSHVILKDNKVEIQRTLNSNYGLFGIVVTDCRTLDLKCPEQKIIYLSDSNRSWRTKVNSSQLTDAPYNLLRDPPPLIAEGGYSEPKNLKWETNKQVNSGKIIGRVYYLRNWTPTFTEDYGRWLGDIFNNSGTNRPYLLAAIAFISSGLFAWLIVWWLMERLLQQRKDYCQQNLQEKQQQESQYLREKENQQEQIESLHGENSDLIQEKENLEQRLAENQEESQKLFDEVQNLKKERIERQNKERVLAQKIEELTTQTKEQQAATEQLRNWLSEREDEATIIRERLSNELQIEKSTEILAIKTKLDNKEGEIARLKKDLEGEHEKYRSIVNDLEARGKELKDVRDSLPVREEQIKELDLKIIHLDREKQELQQNITELSTQNDRLQDRIEQLKVDLLEINDREQRLQSQLLSLKDAETFLEEAIAKEQAVDRKEKETRELIEQLINEIKKMEEEKRKLQKQIQERKQQISTRESQKEIIKRTHGMETIKFAKIATIILQDISNKKDLQEKVRAYYDNKYGKKSDRSIEKYEIVNYLRHEYTNYDNLLNQIMPREMQREEAREILKNRVNAVIWSKCQDWLP